MRYLADENIAGRIVSWLRNRGDDVRYAAQERPGELDSQWLREAEAERRLICQHEQGARRTKRDAATNCDRRATGRAPCARPRRGKRLA